MDHQERPGVPQRPPASAQFNVNSIDRYGTRSAPDSQFAQILNPWSAPNGDVTVYTNEAGLPPPASDYRYSLQRPIMNGYFTRLGASQVNLDWSVPNIIKDFNNEIKVAVPNFSTLTVNLAPGFYSGPDLAANISTATNNALATAGYSFNPSGFDTAWNDTFCGVAVQFLNASTINTGFCFDTTTLSGDEKRKVLTTYDTIGVNYPATQSTLVYTDGTGAVQSSINTGFLLNKYKAPYTSYIDIISDKLSQYMKVKDGETAQAPETNVLARIFTSPPNQSQTFDADGNTLGTRPFRLVWDPNTMKWFKWSPNEAVFDFDIQVKDEYGNLVPWSGRFPFEFNMTMLASET